MTRNVLQDHFELGCGRGVDVLARQAGADILLDVETYGFGERQFSARDIDGYVWTFTHSVDDVDPESWGATTRGA